MHDSVGKSETKQFFLNSSSTEYDQDEENIIELQENWGDEFNEIATILCGFHLNQYVEMFFGQGINLDIFLNLNNEDLCHIGMTNSKDRALLLQGISQLKKNRAAMDSKVQLQGLSSDEVNSILASTVKHLTVIHASLAHLRLNLQNASVHNTLITLKYTSAELLELLTSEAKIQNELVTNQMKSLLAKKPTSESKSPTSRRKLSFTIFSAVVGVVSIYFFVTNKSFKILPYSS